VNTDDKEHYGFLRECLPPCPCTIFKVQNTVNDYAERLIFIDALFTENSGKPYDSRSLTIIVRMGSMPSFTVVNRKQILGKVYSVSELAVQDNKCWYVNNVIYLKIFN
jgi:hypothetical protein